MSNRTGSYLLLSTITLLSVFGCNADNSARVDSFDLRKGDLLFQDVDCPELCDAIETVTQGYNNYNFSHVGIIARDEKGNISVIEAVSAGVSVTDISSFLNRSADRNNMPKVVVGRLKRPYRGLITAALEYAAELKGKSYDKTFAVNNDAYYCSELVYEVFMLANDRQPLFELQPMTFKDPVTGQTLDVWKEYFAQLGVPVPQGEPGINPGGISRSAVLDIVYVYGEPSPKQLGYKNAVSEK